MPGSPTTTVKPVVGIRRITTIRHTVTPPTVTAPSVTPPTVTRLPATVAGAAGTAAATEQAQIIPQRAADTASEPRANAAGRCHSSSVGHEVRADPGTIDTVKWSRSTGSVPRTPGDTPTLAGPSLPPRMDFGARSRLLPMLQRAAGNAAVATAHRNTHRSATGDAVRVQRCGSIPPEVCPCH